MAGVKGAGGPVPKRSDQRRRRNKPATGAVKKVPPKSASGRKPAGRPATNGKWHPVAKRWYNSLADSRQSVFYEPSDWALAYLLAESISRELQPQPVFDEAGKQVAEVSRPPRGSSLGNWLKGMTALLVTEGDRRRLQIELELPDAEGDEEAGSVSSLDAWRDRTSGSG